MVNNFRHPYKKYLPGIIIISLLIILILYKPGFFENRVLYYMPRLFENKALRMASSYWEKQNSTHGSDTLKELEQYIKVTEGTDPDSVIKLEYEKLKGDDLRNQYYIIIGSFVKSENASIASEKYSSQGYKTNIIKIINPKGNKVELVSVKAFSNYNDATRYLREFKSKIDSEAWIYPYQ